ALGFCYDAYLPAAAFSALPAPEKDAALMKAAVVEDRDRDRIHGLRAFDPALLPREYTVGGLEEDARARRTRSLALGERGRNHFRGTVTLDQKCLMFFSIPYDGGWSATVDGRPAK